MDTNLRKPFPGVWTSLLLLLGMAGGQLGLGFLFRGAILEHPLLYLGLVNLIVLGAVAAVGYLISRQAPDWGAGRAVPGGFYAAMAVTVVGGVVTMGFFADVLSRVLPLPPNLARLLRGMGDGPSFEALFSVVIVAPLTEELLFRGLFFRGLDRRYGFIVAALISSALFAVSHFNLVQGIPAFVVGLYLAWLYRVTGTLWWNMAAHALFNGLSLLLALVFPDTSTDPNAAVLPWPVAVLGAAALAGGLLMTKKWAPLSPPPVSDTVAP